MISFNINQIYMTIFAMFYKINPLYPVTIYPCSLNLLEVKTVKFLNN